MTELNDEEKGKIVGYYFYYQQIKYGYCEEVLYVARSDEGCPASKVLGKIASQCR